MIKYPTVYPKPTIEGYAIAVDMGLSRVKMGAGNSKQRRRFRSMPQAFQFNFALPIDSLASWQMWVNDFAYTWFSMDVTSYLSGMPNSQGHCTPHVIRFTSDLAITPINGASVNVQVNAEMAPMNIYGLPVPVTEDWVVGKTPGDPSVDWILGKTPDDPSVDTISAGTPQFPAAHV